MSNEHVKQWIEALRSGEYVQATSRLRKSDGFCCLGVACDVYAKVEDGDARWELIDDYPNDGVFMSYYRFTNGTLGGSNGSMLGSRVQKWLGLESPFGVLPFRDREYEPMDLTILNDSGQFSFQQIADVINYVWGNDK